MSSLAFQIIDSLNDIKYPSHLIENAEKFESEVEKNLVEFSKLISFLTKELSKLLSIDEHVNPIESANDESTLYLEICAFLKEIACPYKALIEDSIDLRFKSIHNRLLLIDFLVSELQAARILASSKPESREMLNSQKSVDESEETKALKKILISLGFPKPPSSVTSTEIWQKVENKCIELLSNLPKNYLGSPLLNAILDESQWEKLIQINQMLSDDFQMRRELLLTRLDVTIQSFKWAERLKKNNSEIATIYQQKRKEFSIKQNVKIYYILAARDDLLKQEKTCSTRLMTRSHLHKIIIPKVPDRGGRTGELQPPPPEMPQFMQRKHSGAHPQEQRYRGGGHKRPNNQQWCNEGQNFKPKSDFERYNNQDYGDNSGRNNNNYNNSGGYGNGRGGGGSYRGNRGGRGRGGY